jgi:hypothetical protein
MVGGGAVDGDVQYYMEDGGSGCIGSSSGVER